MFARPSRAFPVLILTAAVVAITACGSGGGSSTATGAARYGTTPAATTAAPAAAATDLALSADPGGRLAFDTTSLKAKAGSVTLTMTNPSGSGLPHAIAIEGPGVDRDGQVVQPGGTSTVTATLKPGTYTFYCPVAGHEAAGMKGTLTVG